MAACGKWGILRASLTIAIAIYADTAVFLR